MVGNLSKCLFNPISDLSTKTTQVSAVKQKFPSVLNTRQQGSEVTFGVVRILKGGKVGDSAWQAQASMAHFVEMDLCLHSFHSQTGRIIPSPQRCCENYRREPF